MKAGLNFTETKTIFLKLRKDKIKRMHIVVECKLHVQQHTHAVLKLTLHMLQEKLLNYILYIRIVK